MLVLLVPRPLIFVVVLFRFFFSVHLLLMGWGRYKEGFVSVNERFQFSVVKCLPLWHTATAFGRCCHLYYPCWGTDPQTVLTE